MAVAALGGEHMTSAVPKVTTEDMREAQPLYVEPEERDEVTDAAAEITAAATAAVPVTAGGGAVDEAAEASAGDAKPKTAKKTAPAASRAPLTLAERLGLRAPGRAMRATTTKKWGRRNEDRSRARRGGQRTAPQRLDGGLDVLVTFISLTFVGTAALLQLQIAQMKNFWYDRAQVAVYLCTTVSTAAGCIDGEATEEQKEAIEDQLNSPTLKPFIDEFYSRTTRRRSRTSRTSSRAPRRPTTSRPRCSTRRSG